MKELPVLSKLESNLGSTEEENFFFGFRNRLKGCSKTLDFYRWIEEWLAFIPESQWNHFEQKVRNVVKVRDLKKLRYWTQFHDVLFEAYGFRFLLEKLKCSNPEYIISENKAPDFLAHRGETKVLLEVKKINEPQEETEMWYGDREANTVQASYEKLRGKIKNEYEEAIQQLDTYAGSVEYEKNVFMVIEPGITLFSWPEKVVEKIREIVKDIPNGTHGLHFHAIDRE